MLRRPTSASWLALHLSIATANAWMPAAHQRPAAAIGLLSRRAAACHALVDPLCPSEELCALTSEELFAPSPPDRRTTLGPAARARRFGQRSAVKYRRLMQRRYLLLASVQAAVLRGGADVVGRSLIPAEAYALDVEATNVYVHGAALGFVALFVSGVGCASWQRLLEASAGSETTPEIIVLKCTADYFIWAPIANTLYLVLVPLLMGQTPAAAFQIMLDGFGAVSLLELCIWTPYNLLSFRFLPLELRPPTQSALAALFTIGLSLYC